ncbi:MAG TPA: OsmC family protein [Flavisolibacter sp.]|nr:OsmC family protein [Flavisolibacter sp.]
MAKILLERKKGAFGFEVRDELGHLLQTDSSRENGGDDFGFRPMQLLLAALGSCSAIDMVSILAKQRQEISDMSIEIEGEREKDVVPSLWKTVTVVYHLKGKIDAEKAEKAAALSMEKYCSVAETMRRGGTVITWKVNVEPTNG